MRTTLSNSQLRNLKEKTPRKKRSENSGEVFSTFNFPFIFNIRQNGIKLTYPHLNISSQLFAKKLPPSPFRNTNQRPKGFSTSTCPRKTSTICKKISSLTESRVRKARKKVSTKLH
jgi:hypothetical protein